MDLPTIGTTGIKLPVSLIAEREKREKKGHVYKSQICDL
jgi:hypothetical protein